MQRYTIYVLLIVLSQLNIKCSKPKSAAKEQKQPVRKSVPQKKKPQKSQESISSLLRKAKKFNAEKKYKEAIETYESLLELQSSTSLYYQYGNALANAKLYKKAKDAFSHAVQFNKNFKELKYAYYNIACMASLLHNKKESLENIEKAIKYDYTNFDHIKRDPDLFWLREEYPKFNAWLAELISPAGTVVWALGATRSFYYFCGSPGDTSGKFVYDSDDLEAIPFATGTWKVEKNIIHIHTTRERGTRGVGKVIGTLPRSLQYENYEKFDRKVDEHIKYKINGYLFHGSGFARLPIEGPCPTFQKRNNHDPSILYGNQE